MNESDDEEMQKLSEERRGEVLKNRRLESEPSGKWGPGRRKRGELLGRLGALPGFLVCFDRVSSVLSGGYFARLFVLEVYRAEQLLQ